MKRNTMTCLAVVWFVFFAAGAYGADYPTKPINFICPWPAGGSSDMGSRILAQIAEKKMGQTIVVSNKVGAGSQIGLTELARSKPDGYTIGLVNFPALNAIILNPERKAVFNIDSFTPIVSQVVDPGLIFVKADSPYKTLKDVLEDAKKRPGEITASTSGILGVSHLSILMLQEVTGVKFRIVHYDGGAPQMTALLGGQIDVTFDNVGGVPPKIKAGLVRPLALLDRERTRFIPDAPTTVELGYPGVINASARGVMGPKGLPAPVVKYLQDVFLEAMKNKEHVEMMDKAGLTIRPMFGEAYLKYRDEVHERLKRFVVIALGDK
jgi:tripartite-type tricarboxylate transporter receptor subunit TctC